MGLPKIIYLIPKENIEEIYVLADEADRKGDRMSRYKLWKRISDLFPMTLTGCWHIECASILAPRLVEE
jgi:hypothetical protein